MGKILVNDICFAKVFPRQYFALCGMHLTVDMCLITRAYGIIE